MKKVQLFIIIMMLFITGCSSELSFSEVDKENARKDVKEFIESVNDQNGTHLYFDNDGKATYVFLNGGNVIQGEKAVYFEGFEIKAEGDDLYVIYVQKETDVYSNPDLDHQLLYKINLDKDYDKIHAISNGEEVSFGTAFVN